MTPAKKTSARFRRNLSAGRKRKLKISRGKVCQVCGRRFELNALTVHHVVPLSLGGADEDDNLLVACRPCHDRLDAEALGERRPGEFRKTYARCACCGDYVSERKILEGCCAGCRAVRAITSRVATDPP